MYEPERSTIIFFIDKHFAHPTQVRASEGGVPEAHCGNGLQHVPEPNQLQNCHGGSP